MDQPAASVRLLLPPPGSTDLVMPAWNGNEFLFPDGTRPAIRTLTPLRLDPETHTLDLEIVVHQGGFQKDAFPGNFGTYWGQAFEPPMFSDVVDIVSQRLVGERHLKLSVRHAGTLRDAIWFGRSDPLPDRVTLAYRLSLDEYNGRQRVQMVIEAASD